jgi:cysteine sulfinate desulfinase/cysteine desulfurase-like protein/anaerobic selenocysteine-containing dehydrogenase
MTLQKRGICGICSAGCRIVATYDDQGRIAVVEPDLESPMGIICKLAEHAHEIIYSENRLQYPMRRKGARGNYDFERITWDEAYETIVGRLQKIKSEHGPEAAAIYTGVGSFELAFCDIFQPKGVAVSSASSVLFPFGSPNTMGVGALCYTAYGMIAPDLTMGKMFIDMFPEIDNSDLVVVWGANPATDLPPIDMKKILRAKKRGAEVVVIDPRKTTTAKLTDAQWIPIRPGTDGALALGMCNVIIEEELYDFDFVENWTVGFEDYAGYLQHFTPATVENITGVPAQTVVELARRLCKSNGASQYMYTGMEYSNSGVQAIRATIVLWALAGQLDVPGGRCIKMNGNQFPINRDGLIQNPDTGKRIGVDRFPIYIKYRDEAHAIELPKSVLEGDPYKIRALMVLGGSITTSWPQTEIWRKTLNELDFLVCIDRQLTADCAYADIVLPAATYFEIDSYMVYGSQFSLREKMIEPLGEARGDYFILAELAARLGYGELYPQTVEELYNYVLKGSGFNLQQVRDSGGSVSVATEMMQQKKWEKGLLRADGQPGFDTPSGKFEIASGILEEYGYDALPVYTEPKESPVSRPDMLNDYPLIFNSGARTRTSFHTQHRGIAGLVKHNPEPTVMISSEDADERGITHGDMVEIATRRGAVTLRALVTPNIVRGAIEANHACGSPTGNAEWSSKNINLLTDMENYDPISGFPVYKCLLCEVKKVSESVGDFNADGAELLDGELVVERERVVTAEEEVYFDHNATTPLADEVKAVMREFLDEYGNPSSIHEAGRRAKIAADDARRKVGRAIGCTARRILFTGSGSEANNLALKGIAFSRGLDRSHIITSSVEHPAIIKTCQWLSAKGVDVTFLPVDEYGLVNPQDLEKEIRPETVLVSVMLANNETGTIQPVKELVSIAHDKGVLFHCDAVQGLGKLRIDVERLGVDLMSLSAHKIYGPKGIGALYVRKGVELEGLISGGGQEHGLRAGTENVLAMVGFGKAAEKVEYSLDEEKRIAGLRDILQQEICGLIEGCLINGHLEKRLGNTLNLTLPGYRGESVVLALSRRGIYFSSGSACRSGSPAPSATLLAMGRSEEQAHCALRFSLGVENTLSQVEFFLEHFKSMLEDSKNIIQFIPCK